MLLQAVLQTMNIEQLSKYNLRINPQQRVTLSTFCRKPIRVSCVECMTLKGNVQQVGGHHRSTTHENVINIPPLSRVNNNRVVSLCAANQLQDEQPSFSDTLTVT